VGLLFYRARFYAPALGRFLSADPIVPDVKNPQALNRYAYVVNNPLKYNDPSGHCFLVCGLIGAAVGFIGYTASAVINQSGWNAGDAALVTGGGFIVGATAGLVVAAAPEIIGAGAGVVTATCADGDCTNEVQGAVQVTQQVVNACGGDCSDELGTAQNVVTQFNNLACGSACGEMLLKGHGIDVSQQAIAGLAKTPTDPETLASALNAFDTGAGQWVGGGAYVPGADLAQTVNALNSTGSWSAMIYRQGAAMGHFVVVDGYNAMGNLLIRDPAGKSIEMTLTDFLEVWKGMAVWKTP
jgi:filamentous hemagglutinin